MKKKQKIRIILTDDHILLRDTLAAHINSLKEFEVIGVAEDGEKLLEIMEQGLIPDILLLDLSMPNMDGYEAAVEIKKKYNNIKILVLTMYDTEIALIRLLQTGVRGFLKKDIHPDQLNEALYSVAEEGYYYSNAATGRLASFLHKAYCSKTLIDKTLLSEVELEFLRLASTDMTYKEIAGVMKLTPRSIDSHRDGLFDKLDVKSRVGLAIYAVKQGLVAF